MLNPQDSSPANPLPCLRMSIYCCKLLLTFSTEYWPTRRLPTSPHDSLVSLKKIVIGFGNPGWIRWGPSQCDYWLLDRSHASQIWEA